ncbi:MAG: ATP synthase subunit C [Firmicutes bacterium]|nr:ATP synthase subunit C [Bacillota bacterium]
MLKKVIVASFLVLLSLIVSSIVYATSIAGTTGEAVTTDGTASVAAGVGQGTGLGLIAAALSTGLAAIGAGIAVAMVGAAALGAISENPKMLGRTIIFVGLAEGIAIYGLIISIMILNRI